jgi:hypothetical protein
VLSAGGAGKQSALALFVCERSRLNDFERVEPNEFRDAMVKVELPFTPDRALFFSVEHRSFQARDLTFDTFELGLEISARFLCGHFDVLHFLNLRGQLIAAL